MKHIIKINETLSFSNNPLLTYLYTKKVKNLIILSTLFEGNVFLSERSIESLNNLRNYSNEELYIQLTRETSKIVKYNAEPLIATGLYYSLFSLISLVLTSASNNFTLTSLAYVFVEPNTSISPSSSKRFPYDYVNLSNKFLSNLYKSFLF